MDTLNMSKCVFLCRKSRGQVKDGENKDRLKCVIDEDSINMSRIWAI